MTRKREVGRPSKGSTEIRELLLDRIFAGDSRKLAAQACAIGATTLNRWLAESRGGHEPCPVRPSKAQRQAALDALDEEAVELPPGGHQAVADELAARWARTRWARLYPPPAAPLLPLDLPEADFDDAARLLVSAFARLSTSRAAVADDDVKAEAKVLEELRWRMALLGLRWDWAGRYRRQTPSEAAFDVRFAERMLRFNACSRRDRYAYWGLPLWRAVEQAERERKEKMANRR